MAMNNLENAGNFFLFRRSTREVSSNLRNILDRAIFDMS